MSMKDKTIRMRIVGIATRRRRRIKVSMGDPRPN
jgi:hypothetical protein